MGTLTVAALRFGTSSADLYWQSVSDPAQAPRVAMMILFCLVAQTLAIAGVIYLPQLADLSFRAASDLVWATAVFLFVGSRYVAPPQRVARPKAAELAVVALSATAIVTAVAFLFTVFYDGPRSEPSWTGFSLAVPHVVVGALIEEVVFRVFLLTAIVQSCRSSGHALVLSSTAFALAHIPGALAQPILISDSYALAYILSIYTPMFIWQLGLGFVLGALWIRTGSVILIITIHSIFNLGSVWMSGLEWTV